MNDNIRETYRYTQVKASDGNQYPALTWYFEFDPTNEQMSFVVSRCSAKDNFSKAIGRQMCAERNMYHCAYDREQSLVANAIEFLSLIDGRFEQDVVKTYDKIRNMRGIRYHFDRKGKAVQYPRSL